MIYINKSWSLLTTTKHQVPTVTFYKLILGKSLVARLSNITLILTRTTLKYKSALKRLMKLMSHRVTLRNVRSTTNTVNTGSTLRSRKYNVVSMNNNTAWEEAITCTEKWDLAALIPADLAILSAWKATAEVLAIPLSNRPEVYVTATF